MCNFSFTETLMNIAIFSIFSIYDNSAKHWAAFNDSEDNCLLGKDFIAILLSVVNISVPWSTLSFLTVFLLLLPAKNETPYACLTNTRWTQKVFVQVQGSTIVLCVELGFSSSCLLFYIISSNYHSWNRSKLCLR